VRRTKGIRDPETILLMSDQSTNTNDRVMNALRKFVAHCGANFVIALDRGDVEGPPTYML
jgi:hypothetical protein